MLKLQEIRSLYPEYNKITDYELSTAFHKKRHAQMPYEEFAKGFGGPLEEEPNVVTARAYNAKHPDSPIHPDDIGQGSYADDMGHSFAAGVNDIAALPFWAAEKGLEAVGADWMADKSKAAKEYFGRSAEEKRQGVSADMKLAREKQFVTEDENGEYGLGDAWSDPRAVGGMIAESVPSMGVSIIGAAGVANTLVKMGLSRPLAWGIGSSVGEGSVAGAQNSMSAHDAVMQMPEESLEQSPEYQELRQSMEPAQARKALANGIAGNTAWKTALSTGLLSAPSGALFGKVLGGEVGKNVFRTMGKQATAEGLEETLQSGAEHYIQQSQLQRADQSIDPVSGLANAAVAGGIAGAFMGAGMGGVGHMAGRNARNAESLNSGEEDIEQTSDETVQKRTPHDLDSPQAKRLVGLTWLEDQEAQGRQRAEELRTLRSEIESRYAPEEFGVPAGPEWNAPAHGFDENAWNRAAAERGWNHLRTDVKQPESTSTATEVATSLNSGEAVDLLSWGRAEEKPDFAMEALPAPKQNIPLPMAGIQSMQSTQGTPQGRWAGGRSQLAYGPQPMQGLSSLLGPQQPAQAVPTQAQVTSTQDAPRADTMAQANALGMPAPQAMAQEAQAALPVPPQAQPQQVAMPVANTAPAVVQAPSDGLENLSRAKLLDMLPRELLPQARRMDNPSIREMIRHQTQENAHAQVQAETETQAQINAPVTDGAPVPMPEKYPLREAAPVVKFEPQEQLVRQAAQLSTQEVDNAGREARSERGSDSGNKGTALGQRGTGVGYRVDGENQQAPLQERGMQREGEKPSRALPHGQYGHGEDARSGQGITGTVRRNANAGRIEGEPQEKYGRQRSFVQGRSVSVKVPGKPDLPVTYELVEADAVQASHLAHAGFQKNPHYALENERRYHDEPGSKAKVLENALRLDPAFLLSSVDANHGAPVLDQQGNVLGGNGRAMSIQYAYDGAGKSATVYRDALRANADALGLNPSSIEGMERPMLVRRVRDDISPEARQALVTAMNDDFKDSREKKSEGITRGERLSPTAITMLAEGMKEAEAESLREFFDSTTSLPLVERLMQDGVLQTTERNSLVAADGLLNPDGKTKVEAALRVLYVSGRETLSALPADIKAKMDVVLPHILVAENVGGEWAILQDVRAANDLIVAYKGSGHKEPSTFLNQIDMIKGKSPSQDASPLALGIFARALEDKKAEFAEHFKRYASGAKLSTGFGIGQPRAAILEEQFGVKLPADMKREAKGKPVASASGAAPQQKEATKNASVQGAGDALASRKKVVERPSDEKLVRVVDVDPSAIPVDLSDTKGLVAWLRDYYGGSTVSIRDTGEIAKFTNRGLRESAKRRGVAQRQGYAALDKLLEEAVYDGFEAADAKHAAKLKGQNVYYSVTRMGDRIYSVKFKLDVPLHGDGLHYKDHKISELEMAPTLYQSSEAKGSYTLQNINAISEISLSILKGDVNPSSPENGVISSIALASRKKVAERPKDEKLVRVVDVDPSNISADWRDTKALLAWLREIYQGSSVTVEDDGQRIVIGRRGLEDSLKRKGEDQRKAYADLLSLLESAVYDSSTDSDERHKGKVRGQKIYYSAMRLPNGKLFAVKFKVDIPLSGEHVTYKDHKVREIEIAPVLSLAIPSDDGVQQKASGASEIAPVLYRGVVPEGRPAQTQGAIREITLGVLRGEVNPSSLEKGVISSIALASRKKVPAGSTIVGRIDEDMAKGLPLKKSGDIRLDAEGIAHIEEKHGKDIRAVGFADAKEFVQHVAKNFDYVYQGTGPRDVALVVHGSKNSKRAILKLEFAPGGDFYRVKTAGPVGSGFYKNKSLLWERAPTSQLSKESPNAISGQSSTLGENGILSDTEVNELASITPGQFLPPRRARALRVRVNAVQRVADALGSKAKNAAPVRVVQAFSELPEHIQSQYADSVSAIEGVYDPQTKTVWLVADNISDAGRAAEVWAHEQVVHHGLRGMFSDVERKQVLTQLWAKLGGMSNELISEVAGRYEVNPRIDAKARESVMEEVISVLAEKRMQSDLTAQEEKWWQRIVDAVLRAWDNLVRSVSSSSPTMKVADIDGLLSALGKYVMDGESQRHSEGGFSPASLRRERQTSEAAYTAWEQLQEDTVEWGRQVDAYRQTPSGEAGQRELLTVCRTPDVLQKLGAPDLPMTMTHDNLKKILSDKPDHGLPKDLVKQLPEALADPIMVFESATQAEAFVVLTELKHEGRSVMAAVHLDAERQRIRVNDISSAYRRGNDGWYIRQIEEGRLLYQDKSKSLAWARTKGLQLPRVRKLPARLSDGRILTEKDVVKPIKPESDAPLASRKRAETRASPLSLSSILEAGIRKTMGIAENSDIRRVMGEEDLSILSRIVSLPHWIAKQFPDFSKVYERQLTRMDERSAALKKSLESVSSVFGDTRLKAEDMNSLRELIWAFEGQDPVALKGVEKYLVKEALTNGRELIEANPAFYTAYKKWLDSVGKGTKSAKEAMLEIRKSLDADLALAHNRMAAMSEMSDDAIKEFRQTIGHVPNYFPHHRYGAYYVQAKVGKDVVYRKHFDASTEAMAKVMKDKIANEVREEFPDAQWVWGKNTRLPDEVLGAPIDTEAMEQIIMAATSKIADKERAGQVRDLLTEGMADMLKARGWNSHSIGRKGIPGFETEDISKILYDYKSGLNGWLTKMEAARDFSGALGKIDAGTSPNLWRYTSQYVKDMLRNSDRVDRITGTIKSVAFAWYLGGSIKTAFVNMTQNIVVGVPRLQMDVTGGGMMWLNGAQKAIVDRVTGNKGKGLTEEEARLVQELYGESVITDAFMEEIRGHISGVTGATLWNKFMKVLGLPMSEVERFNRASLALAAFRAARSGNFKARAREKYGVTGRANYDQAKQFAADVVRDAHFVYGKPNMPEFMRSNTAGRMAAPMYTFRTFTHNMVAMWLWALKTQGKEGATFVAKSIGATMALGGVTALPLYATLMALCQAMSGDDDDWTESIRSWLPNNNLLRDVVCYGAPAMGGVNVGGSLKMETPITKGLTDGKNPQEVLGESIGDIIGIPYDLLVVKTSRTLDAHSKGNTWRTLEEAAPVVIKNAMQAWRLYNEGQTTMTGRAINDPGTPGARKLSASEAFGKALGFQPVSSTKSYDAYAAGKRSEAVRSDKIDELTVLALKTYDSGAPTGRLEMTRKLLEWNDKMRAEDKPHMLINLKDVNRRVTSRRRENRPTGKAMQKKARIDEVWR